MGWLVKGEESQTSGWSVGWNKLSWIKFQLSKIHMTSSRPSWHDIVIILFKLTPSICFVPRAFRSFAWNTSICQHNADLFPSSLCHLDKQRRVIVGILTNREEANGMMIHILSSASIPSTLLGDSLGFGELPLLCYTGCPTVTATTLMENSSCRSRRNSK